MEARKSRRFRGGIALLLSGVFILFLALAAACFGRFSVTRSIYGWNGAIENRFLRSAVMVALFLVPAYPVAAVTDTVVFNVIEFWTGENPVLEPTATPEKAEVPLDDGSGARVVIEPAPGAPPGAVEVRVEPASPADVPPPGDGTSVSAGDGAATAGGSGAAVLEPGPGGAVAARPPEGGVVVTVRPTPEGGVEILDPTGRILRTMSPAEVDALFGR